jgi:O-antigen/teichoic acid export membrane protein
VTVSGADSSGSLVLFGRRLGRHVGVYAGAHIGTFLFAMVNLAVLTRLLPIEEYGRLAVYLLLATMLTMIYNLGSLQGTLIAVFGAGGAGEEMGLEEAEGKAVTTDSERALTTGVLLTVAIAALGTALVFAAAPVFASILGQPGELDAVRLAALCGATGAVWRLVQNVPRLERRPLLYSSLNLLRPALALGLGTGLVVAGFGIEGALAGIAAGTALAIPVAILVGRRNYAWGVDMAIVPDIFRRGAMVIPIIAAMWIVTNVDLYLVSAYAPADAIGPYRVAMRLGAGVSYLVSAVSTAFLPLKRTPLYTALKEEHGPSGFGSTMLSAFLFVCIWAVLGLALLADVLIRIAPASYADAAPLVPLIGLGMVACGVVMVLYRGAKFPSRRNWHIGMMLTASVIFVVSGLILVPAFGGYGAAVAQIIAFTVAALVLLFVVQRSEHPLRVKWGKLARAVAIGLACILFGQLVSPLAGEWRILVDLLILAAFPALLLLARAFPSEELHAFIDISRPSRPRRHSPALVEKLKRLEPGDRRALSVLVSNGSSSAEAAEILAMPESLLLSRFVASLREVGAHPTAVLDPGGEGEDDGDADAPDRDAELASYLLSGGGVATRDRLGEQLCEDGVDPLDLDILDTTLGRLRRIPRREWERLAS